MGIRVARLFQPKAETRRGGLFNHAAQGEPDRLREFRGQSRARQRALTSSRGQTADLALAARFERLDGAAQYGRRAWLYAAGDRVMQERSCQARGRSGETYRRSGSQLGSARRTDSDRHAALRRAESV